eukprot:TRINITY_DN8255_c0_g1_i1.p1 TRINITY_DN8255_c0_g1~~TRINITY_DN8255_c0_g1_i1.p1  ORF type:complete len:290 (-),score=69.01 TRINITY_DN8255_c0_g1_i1:540-1364(-)
MCIRDRRRVHGEKHKQKHFNKAISFSNPSSQMVQPKRGRKSKKDDVSDEEEEPQKKKGSIKKTIKKDAKGGKKSAKAASDAKDTKKAKTKEKKAAASGGDSKKKTAKKEKKKSKSPLTQAQLDDIEEMKDSLLKYTNEQLKDMLRKNDGKVTGTKPDLIDRVAEGKVLGKVPKCPRCFGGKPNFDRNTGIYRCPGFQDDDQFRFCNKKFEFNEITREKWEDQNTQILFFIQNTWIHTLQRNLQRKIIANCIQQFAYVSNHHSCNHIKSLYMNDY